MRRGQGETIALVLIGALGLLFGCATNKPEMAWVRTDGRKILDDPALLKKGETDIALGRPRLGPAHLPGSLLVMARCSRPIVNGRSRNFSRGIVTR
jgi:hypothetical protein